MQFEINQIMNIILLGKTINGVVLVLPYALHQITDHADIKCAVALAGEDVNARLLDIILTSLHAESIRHSRASGNPVD
jgi:hypothetical protein